MMMTIRKLKSDKTLDDFTLTVIYVDDVILVTKSLDTTEVITSGFKEKNSTEIT